MGVRCILHSVCAAEGDTLEETEEDNSDEDDVDERVTVTWKWFPRNRVSEHMSASSAEVPACLSEHCYIQGATLTRCSLWCLQYFVVTVDRHSVFSS